MTLRAKDLVNKCRELFLDLKNGEAQNQMGEAILNLLKDENAQDEIDLALSLAMAESKPIYNLLNSHLEWHICHQVKVILEKGSFFMSQILIPVTIFNDGEDINPEISGLAINHIANDLLSLLEMPDDSIIIFNENLQRGIDLRGGHVKRFNVPNQMNSNNWPHMYEKLTLPDTGSILYFYAMVFEPISKNQVSLNIDKFLTTPSETFDWRQRTEKLLVTQFKAKGSECRIMVGNPSSYSVGLNQSAGYLKLLSTFDIVKKYIAGLLSDNAIVILNESPSNHEISIQVFEGNVCQGALSYGNAVFKSGVGCENDFLDRDWIKEGFINMGFENVVMDNKEIDSKDLSLILSSGRFTAL